MTHKKRSIPRPKAEVPEPRRCDPWNCPLRVQLLHLLLGEAPAPGRSRLLCKRHLADDLDVSLSTVHRVIHDRRVRPFILSRRKLYDVEQVRLKLGVKAKGR